MKKFFFSKTAVEKITHIHRLSLKYNSSIRKPHVERLLELMDDHVKEIKELINQDNPHGAVENGDLLILCLELLVESGKDINEIFELCCRRYEQKLQALQNAEGN
jgi:hypothetical protein